MKFSGNIRKMKSDLDEVVEYRLPLYNILEPSEEIPMNDLVGERIRIQFEHEIHCVISGKKIRKVFGEGMSYEAFMNSPQASPSIVRPELSRIHEGIALRDYEWEMAHHMQPHVVYLSLTSGVKVGVTRETQIPTRWIDQGAVQALVIAETPYRQLAGLIEVSLKNYVADKTNWQAMLKNEYPHLDLFAERDKLQLHMNSNFEEYLVDDEELVEINYPVKHYLNKVKSVKLDTSPEIEDVLIGIKGQYLMFESGQVLNVRNHAGYRISLEC